MSKPDHFLIAALISSRLTREALELWAERGGVVRATNECTSEDMSLLNRLKINLNLQDKYLDASRDVQGEPDGAA